MSEETFDGEEDGFTFSDEDFGRRYFAEQNLGSASGGSNSSGAGTCQAKSSTARIHGGGNSFMRALRRRLAAAASNRSG
jgi:hypothetical protein